VATAEGERVPPGLEGAWIGVFGGIGLLVLLAAVLRRRPPAVADIVDEPVATPAPSVFLSYASADRPRARLVVDALQAEGLTVWWDQRTEGGRIFDAEIERHLDAARVVVVLWSPAAAASDWVREEANRARDRRILVPAQIATGGIPFGFGMLQAPDLSTWRGERHHDRWRQVVDAIRRVLGDDAPDPLVRYRNALVERLDTLPEVFRRAHPSGALTDVFVQVRLAPHATHEPDGLWRQLDDRRHLRSDARWTLAEVLGLEPRCWSLLGDPGSGKTTLLRRLALDLLRQPAGLVPIYVRVPDLSAGDSLEDAVAGWGREDAAALRAEVARGQAVLLLDGLDEHDDRQTALDIVVRLAGEVEPCKVLLASRPIGYAAPSRAFHELHLCGLLREQQEELLGNWVDDPALVMRTLDRMQRRPRLARIVENPLLLTLVGIVLLADPGRDLPERRSALYRKAVQALLTRNFGPGGGAIRDPVLVTEALGRLAIAVHGTDDPVSQLRDLVRELREAREVFPRLQEQWTDAERFLADVAHRTALLMPVPNAEEVEGYAFPHRTLREFLAATALEGDIGVHGIGEVPPDALEGAARDGRRVELPPAPGKLGEVLTAATDDPARWSEVLALTCGLVGERASDKLVRRVAAEGSPELVQRVVAEAEGLARDTVLAALGVQRGQANWEARQELVEGLPELVGDPAVVVSLLEQLARGTTHGADRWFVHRQLEAIAAGRCGASDVPGDVSGSAALLVRRFWLDHRVEERRASWAELERWWRAIPAGRFTMGSPDDEEGRFANEGPQHEVTVTGPFEMMAVPVTNAMYERFDPEHRSERGDGEDHHPVADVTWYEAMAFAAWLEAQAEPGVPGRRVALPHEVEWEYACRAGTTTRFWSGDREADLHEVGWVAANSGGRTHPVGAKPANPWGLHDVHGNVFEWCSSPLDPYPSESHRHDPLPPPDLTDPGARRVGRGGSFVYVARVARSADRVDWPPSFRGPDRGFRLVRAPAPQPDGD